LFCFCSQVYPFASLLRQGYDVLTLVGYDVPTPYRIASSFLVS
jgi:hypothetical protein